MSSFSEDSRVKFPTIKHLMEMGYRYISFKGFSFNYEGKKVTLNKTEVEPQTSILIDIFKESYFKLNPGRTQEDIERLLNKIITTLDNDDLGKQFYREILLNPDERIIDLSSEYNFTAKNTFQVTTELTCGNLKMDNYRPDITLFVNGLPLAFIEVKKDNNVKGIQAETERMKVRFQNRAFRRYLNITQIMVFSNDMEYALENRPPIQGAYYAAIGKRDTKYSTFREDTGNLFSVKKHFKEVSPEDEKAMLYDNNVPQYINFTEYKTNCSISNTPTKRICDSLFSFERLFFLLRYGIAYADYGFGHQKHIIRYPQMFAIKAIERMLEQGVQKGIIWHTQGSGKTALTYFSIKYLTDYFAKQGIIPQFFFIVDRIDLLLQAQMEFACRGLKVTPVQTREEFKNIISSPHNTQNISGLPEITVVNIQKFSSDSRAFAKNAYNLKVKRIYFIDEAHRDYNPKGSFLKNLITSDTEAIRIALTGTPIISHAINTKDIFGDYIHTYYYNASISDGYTLRLMREKIDSDFIIQMQEKLKNLQVQRNQVRIKDVYSHKNYVEPLIDYIVEDLNKFRSANNDPSLGGMIVCNSKEQAKTMYRIFLEKYADDSEVKRENDNGSLIIESVSPEEIDPTKHFYAPNNKLRAALILSDTDSKDIRKRWIELFKNGNVDLLIVYQMLQTGFDAPRLKKLYLNRLVKEHNLLQTLTRVNRPYKELKYGYVVDFADIEQEYSKTNSRYQQELNDEVGSDNSESYNRLFVSEEEAKNKIEEACGNLEGFDLRNPAIFGQQLNLINDISALQTIKQALETLHSMCNMLWSQGSQNQNLFKSILEQLHFKDINNLIKAVNNRIRFLSLNNSSENNANTRELVFTALETVSFSFKETKQEVLELEEQFKETVANIREQFSDNIDPKDPEYVNLYQALVDELKKSNFKDSTNDTNYDHLNLHDMVDSLTEILKKLKDLNARDNIRAAHYRGDRKFARIEKRIEEKNNAQDADFTFSKDQQLVIATLSEIKDAVDEQCLKNEDIISNEGYFETIVRSRVTRSFKDHFGSTTKDARLYVTDLVCKEYSADSQVNNIFSSL